MKKFILILGLISFGVNADEKPSPEFRAMSRAAVTIIQTVCLVDNSNYKSYEECYEIYSDRLRTEFRKEFEKELGIE